MYKFYTTKNKVICVTTYAGKTIRGIAKCAPNDEFDYEKGKKLAQARCDLKVARARYRRAQACHKAANDAYFAAGEHLSKMADYLADAVIAEDEAYNDLKDLLNEF